MIYASYLITADVALMPPHPLCVVDHGDVVPHAAAPHQLAAHRAVLLPA